MARGKIYLIGALGNPEIPALGVKLRARGFDVFDEWHGAGPEADREWMRYEQERGRHYRDALYGHAAQNIFEFDKRHLDESDAAVLVLPAGKSAHLELGYMAGRGKMTFVLFQGEPEKWDVMYSFATALAFGDDELLRIVVRRFGRWSFTWLARLARRLLSRRTSGATTLPKS